MSNGMKRDWFQITEGMDEYINIIFTEMQDDT